jgi:SM-20-related protein
VFSKETIDSFAAYRQHYSEHGWVSIGNFFAPDAAMQLSALVEQATAQQSLWSMATLVQGKAFVSKMNDYLNEPPQVRSYFIAELLRYAQQNDFQYFYEYIRLIGEEEQVPPILQAMADLMAATDVVDMLKAIVGLDEQVNIDAQLTRYRAGHFLKQHNDEITGDAKTGAAQQRKVAYILGLSQDWQADWGGLLHIKNDQDQIIKSFTPAFNTITLFKVPTAHFVSQVSNYCPASRFSIAGWIKEG